MDKYEACFRSVLVAGGVVCLVVYAITGQNGALTGAAGTLIGLAIDLFNSRKKPSP